jgi:glutathione synthase/RimK-type ligase-like ATP-grasp enzyme
MKRVLVAPYKMGSAGAKSLARSINAKRTKAHKRLRPDVVLVNWGRSDLDVRGRPFKVLNPSNVIIRATNKLSCLQRLREAGVSAIDFTVSRDQVSRWLTEGHTVYARTLLNASQGKGIIVLKPGETREIPYAPLYTKGVLKAHEYRVHVFGDKIIDVTKKRRRNDVDRSDYIKNLSNGWVYCREGIEVPENLLTVAKQAIAGLGLDFGAVDVLYRKGQPYVLEINTAPGLQGTTLTKYTTAFNSLKFL